MALSKAWKELLFNTSHSTVPTGLWVVLCSSNPWHYILGCQMLSQRCYIRKSECLGEGSAVLPEEAEQTQGGVWLCWVGSDAWGDETEWGSRLLQLVENKCELSAHMCNKESHYYIHDYYQTSRAQYFSVSKFMIWTTVKMQIPEPHSTSMRFAKCSSSYLYASWRLGIMNCLKV